MKNLTFFITIDELVRESMKQFETRLLPTVKQAVLNTGVPVVDIPLEGYYHETSKLSEFLTNLRALQNNESDVVTDSVRKLHKIYSNPVFGLYPAHTTKINKGRCVPIGDNIADKTSVISPMYDSLGLAVVRVVTEYGFNFSIESLMKELESQREIGTGLVDLAFLVDKKYKQFSGSYNPVALAAAAESTIGSRACCRCLGIDEDVLDKEVEHKGIEVISAYNKLFQSYEEGHGLNITTDMKELENASVGVSLSLLKGRCVALANNIFEGVWYHWAIVGNEDDYEGPYEGLKVVEFTSRSVITTNDIIKKLSEAHYDYDRALKLARSL